MCPLYLRATFSNLDLMTTLRMSLMTTIVLLLVGAISYPIEGAYLIYLHNFYFYSLIAKVRNNNTSNGIMLGVLHDKI